MANAKTWAPMSPELAKVAERASREPDGLFYSLAYLIDTRALERAYHRLRNDAAPGVDGITKEQYGENLEDNLQDLHERMKSKRYRHQVLRRVNIPKGPNKTRPIAISTTEDKIVQGALREALEAVYEQDFLSCSYGFRPGRSPHNAVRAFDRVASRGEANWVLEADIQSFFDSVNRPLLMEMLQVRIVDGSIKRLVGKCLHVGVLEGETFTRPEDGTPQGSIISPLLGNIYLHYALDLWFEKKVKPRLSGKATLIRYADDFILCFENKRDAERVMEVLPQRMAKFDLTLHPEKTRLIPFQRPPRSQQSGKGPGTFDFLGFTWYWNRTRNGCWRVGCKTKRAKLRKVITGIHDWCRSHRHWKVPEQHAALKRKIQGHLNYFGVSGNTPSLKKVVAQARRYWYKWLCRRSQKKRLNWKRFDDLLRDYPLPRPRIRVNIWAGAP